MVIEKAKRLVEHRQGRRDPARLDHAPRARLQHDRARLGQGPVRRRRQQRPAAPEALLRRRAQHRGGRLADDRRHGAHRHRLAHGRGHLRRVQGHRQHRDSPRSQARRPARLPRDRHPEAAARARRSCSCRRRISAGCGCFERSSRRSPPSSRWSCCSPRWARRSRMPNSSRRCPTVRRLEPDPSPPSRVRMGVPHETQPDRQAHRAAGGRRSPSSRSHGCCAISAAVGAVSSGVGDRSVPGAAGHHSRGSPRWTKRMGATAWSSFSPPTWTVACLRPRPSGSRQGHESSTTGASRRTKRSSSSSRTRRRRPAPRRPRRSRSSDTAPTSGGSIDNPRVLVTKAAVRAVHVRRPAAPPSERHGRGLPECGPQLQMGWAAMGWPLLADDGMVRRSGMVRRRAPRAAGRRRRRAGEHAPRVRLTPAATRWSSWPLFSGSAALTAGLALFLGNGRGPAVRSAPSFRIRDRSVPRPPNRRPGGCNADQTERPDSVVVTLTAGMDGRMPPAEAVWEPAGPGAFENRGVARFEAIVVELKDASAGIPATPPEVIESSDRVYVGRLIDNAARARREAEVRAVDVRRPAPLSPERHACRLSDRRLHLAAGRVEQLRGLLVAGDRDGRHPPSASSAATWTSSRRTRCTRSAMPAATARVSRRRH